MPNPKREPEGRHQPVGVKSCLMNARAKVTKTARTRRRDSGSGAGMTNGCLQPSPRRPAGSSPVTCYMRNGTLPWIHDEHHRSRWPGFRCASQRPSPAGRHRAMTTPGLSPIPRHPSEFACIDLINSAFTHHLGQGPGFDRLPRREWRAWFLSRHGIEVDPGHPVPIDQLAALRDQLRVILRQWARAGSLTAGQTDALDAWVSKAPLRQRVRQISGRPGLAVEPIDRDWAWAMARIAASAAELAGGGAPERLKVCSNPDCSWMFYDHTLNRSQRFCSTTPCATVVRVRRFRRRGVRPSLLASRPAPRANRAASTDWEGCLCTRPGPPGVPEGAAFIACLLRGCASRLPPAKARPLGS
jgi:CGNR zinc finger/Putative stress-induced transcription regulator